MNRRSFLKGLAAIVALGAAAVAGGEGRSAQPQRGDAPIPGGSNSSGAALAYTPTDSSRWIREQWAPEIEAAAYEEMRIVPLLNARGHRSLAYRTLGR